MALNASLMAEIFGAKAPVKLPEKKQPAKQFITFPLEDRFLFPCSLEDFMRAICSKYGMGSMDIFSGLQVWFSADDAVHLLGARGYSLPLTQALEYISSLLKLGLLEERESLGDKQYRRKDFLFAMLKKHRR